MNASVDWKAEYERKCAEFQRETMRTSELTRLVNGFVAHHCDLHYPGPWSRSCDLCALIGDAERLLATPINAASQATAKTTN